METDHNGVSDRDDSQSPEHEFIDYRSGSEETDLSMTAKVSNDEGTENREGHEHHGHHGNRKYRMFRNHSSANDQPRTHTGPGI